MGCVSHRDLRSVLYSWCPWDIFLWQPTLWKPEGKLGQDSQVLPRAWLPSPPPGAWSPWCDVSSAHVPVWLADSMRFSMGGRLSLYLLSLWSLSRSQGLTVCRVSSERVEVPLSFFIIRPLRLFPFILSCAQTASYFMTRKVGKFGHLFSQCIQFDIHLSFTWVNYEVLTVMTVFFLESCLWVYFQSLYCVTPW